MVVLYTSRLKLEALYHVSNATCGCGCHISSCPLSIVILNWPSTCYWVTHLARCQNKLPAPALQLSPRPRQWCFRFTGAHKSIIATQVQLLLARLPWSPIWVKHVGRSRAWSIRYMPLGGRQRNFTAKRIWVACFWSEDPAIVHFHILVRGTRKSE